MRSLKVIAALLSILGACGTGWGQEEKKKEILVVDRFTGGVDGKGIPKGWTLEETPGNDSKFAIEQDKDGPYVRMLSVNDNFGLKKELSFNLKKHPYLNWRWKALRLPKGGDVRNKETDDQAGQLYVLFPRWPAKVNTRSVGYLWDSGAPPGSFGTSTAYSKMKYFVLQSGAKNLEQWVWESRNVYADYKKLFGDEPPELGGILLYINSQHTKTSGEIGYADIFFSETPADAGKK